MDAHPDRERDTMMLARCLMLAAGCAMLAACAQPGIDAQSPIVATSAASSMPLQAPAQPEATPLPPTLPAPAEKVATAVAPATAAPATATVPTPTNQPNTPRSLATQFPQPFAEVEIVEHFLAGDPLPPGAGGLSTNYRYGMTWDGRLAPHHGSDYTSALGQPVIAVGDATVFYSGPDLGPFFGIKPDFYGNVVVIKLDVLWNETDVYALYGHLDTVLVKTGAVVSAGEVLGTVGDTGVAYGPHLHFEIRIGDDPTIYTRVRNPELWLRPPPYHGVLAGRVVNAAGYLVPGQRVYYECASSRKRHVDTYWDIYTPSDRVLLENFVAGNILAGECVVTTEWAGARIEKRTMIEKGKLSFVVLTLPD